MNAGIEHSVDRAAGYAWRFRPSGLAGCHESQEGDWTGTFAVRRQVASGVSEHPLMGLKQRF